MAFALFLIWKYEGFRKHRTGETQQIEEAGALYEDETWRACLKGIHPTWLLAFRVFAFIVLLVLLIVFTGLQRGSRRVGASDNNGDTTGESLD
jgi:hypothetical protein